MKYKTISPKQFFSCERRDLLCSHSNGDIFTCENNMLFSRVKISCFRAKAHLVFHWCLYNKIIFTTMTAAWKEDYKFKSRPCSQITMIAHGLHHITVKPLD